MAVRYAAQFLALGLASFVCFLLILGVTGAD